MHIWGPWTKVASNSGLCWGYVILDFSKVSISLWKRLFKVGGGSQGLWETLNEASVQFSRSVVSNSLQPHEPQHARPPCPSPVVYSNPCPLSWWCHPTISSSVIPFSRLQSFSASGSFPMSQLIALGGQSTGVSASASVLPMNTQNWSPLGWAGWISLQSEGLSRVFSNTIVQKHQFFGTQLSSQSNSHIHASPLEKA